MFLPVLTASQIRCAVVQKWNVIENTVHLLSVTKFLKTKSNLEIPFPSFQALWGTGRYIIWKHRITFSAGVNWFIFRGGVKRGFVSREKGCFSCRRIIWMYKCYICPSCHGICILYNFIILQFKFPIYMPRVTKDYWTVLKIKLSTFLLISAFSQFHWLLPLLKLLLSYSPG